MKTLALFSDSKFAVPAATAWYLESLGEFRGKQELYTRQSPQKLRVLREHALIESAVSSNRIEGVSVDASRIQSVLVATQPLFRDRDEEEIRGYRDALKWIHEQSPKIQLDESTLKRMHAMARGQRLVDGDLQSIWIRSGNAQGARTVGERFDCKLTAVF